MAKTKNSQIKASMEYDKRNGLVVIGCKVTVQQKKIIDKYLKDSGLNRNVYLKSLIKADLDAKGIPYPNDNSTEDNIPD